MSIKPFVLWVLASLTLSVTSHMPPAGAAEAGHAPLTVSSCAICRHLSGLTCIDKGKQFTPDVGRLYCLTRVAGALAPTYVTHVWYFGGRETCRIRLAVDSASWRTYSQKTIPAHNTGTWRVAVLGPQGERLSSISFEVGPAGPGTPGDIPLRPHKPEKGQKHTDTKHQAHPADKSVPPEPTKHPRPEATQTGPIHPSPGIPSTQRAPRPTAPAKHPPQRIVSSSSQSRIIGRDMRLDLNTPGSEKLYMDLNSYPHPSVVVLGGAAPAVAIHIINVSTWNGRPAMPVNGKAITRIRSGLHRDSGTLRILLDLDPQVPCQVKSYRESQKTYCVEVLYEDVSP